jgi:hypothetical protein
MGETKAFDWDELEYCTQEERIAKLKSRVKELGGDFNSTFEAPDAPPEILEQFWRNVVEFEERDRGLFPYPSLPPLNFPSAEGLDSKEVNRLLWKKIHELAERKIFLEQTDHLSDRELYAQLCTPEMKELTTQAVPDHGSIHFDILGGYSDEDIDLYLKYYAGEPERTSWQEEWPEERIPPKETPPYKRDSELPKPEMP